MHWVAHSFLHPDMYITWRDVHAFQWWWKQYWFAFRNRSWRGFRSMWGVYCYDKKNHFLGLRSLQTFCWWDHIVKRHFENSRTQNQDNQYKNVTKLYDCLKSAKNFCISVCNISWLHTAHHSWLPNFINLADQKRMGRENWEVVFDITQLYLCIVHVLCALHDWKGQVWHSIFMTLRVHAC